MRADRDIIARDRAGVERYVAFGSDLPRGWEYVRDVEGGMLPPDAGVPRTIGNVDAARVRTERIEGDLERQRTRTVSAGEGVTTPEPDPQVEPIRPLAVDYDEQSKEDLEAEADRRGITVEGTGKDGNVLKDDLVAALKAASR